MGQKWIGPMKEAIGGPMRRHSLAVHWPNQVMLSGWRQIEKIKLIMPVDDAVEAILDALPAFLRRVYVKRCQEVAYQEEI